jgi:hypothetical protein
LEGYDVDLVRLLLYRDNNKYSRDDDEDEDKSIYLIQKANPRLDKSLIVLEFILAFTCYINETPILWIDIKKYLYGK